MKQATIRSRANALACHLLTAALAVTASAFLIHTECEAQDHYVEGARIKHNGISKQYRGVNAPHMFGGSSSAMAGWGIDIVREYISDVNNVPTGNTSIQDPQTGQWLHGLRKIVNDNRAHGKITILCPFQWNLDGGWEEEYCGKIPNGRTFYSQHRARLRTWAYEFRNDSDVWISPWNEPTYPLLR
ncbi:MAG: hypothetical protein EOP84_26810 [Verrucomicrobiaceae bacterium]|nr:MAG: hypothetical protein EOP84_26810 [Verrucomicrobiaceae bacterium]